MKTMKSLYKRLVKNKNESIIIFNEEEMNMLINWEETGIKIKNIMRENGYSMKKMENELQVSESTVKNYIYAGTKIPADVLYHMTKLFKVEKIEDLLVFV